jgi:predicted MPP superfamily phosphohydrolase
MFETHGREILEKLEKRLGRSHARLRLGIENDNEQRVFGGGINFFHIENWYSIHSLIRNSLRLTGLYWRGHKNTTRIQIRHNHIRLAELPPAFDGYRILHISDMHVDMNDGVMHRLVEILLDLDYDICVLTGDYRGKTYGPIDETIEGMAYVRSHMRDTVYGVLGNHDTVRMVPSFEEMGITMLLNESIAIERDNSRIHLAGIDDAHYYRVDNIEKTTDRVPDDEFSILLSHTPEIYRQAAHAGFNVLLGGHTHGGQICLPGQIPITLDARLPRHMGSGSWKFHNLIGYTSAGVGASIVPVRFNCLPEVTLHHLHHT